METLLQRLLSVTRPHVGWPRALVGLAAVLCVPVASLSSRVPLPTGLLLWGGVLGFVLGLSIAGPASSTQASGRGRAVLATVVRSVAWICLAVAVALLLMLAGGRALPPPALAERDAQALITWIAAEDRAAQPPPESAALAFMRESIPLMWDALDEQADIEESVRSLLPIGTPPLAWIGALLFGWALTRGRSLLFWEVPLLTVVIYITLFGEGSAMPLVICVGLLLILAASGDFFRRMTTWERSGVDFSSELRTDVMLYTGIIVAGVLVLALLPPAWLFNPIANAFWRSIDPESLEEISGAPPGFGIRPPTNSTIGISQLPALRLGESLEQGPPDQVALQVRLETPLPETGWPHYWRARLYNIYTGGTWTTDARVSPLEGIDPTPDAFPNAVLHTVIDQNPNRGIIIGLPTIVGLDIDATNELLPDGSVAAITVDQPVESYRIISRPLEFADPPPPDRPEVDMSSYLSLPESTPTRVLDLAREITEPDQTAYERALAIETYLRELPYSYEVQPLPSDVDAVDQFLFEMRQGYCTYYASAMAVLARSVGIPARVATGYASGTYDAASNTYLVYENDAHAWPELYLDDRWLPFEPTPIRPLPARVASDRPVLPLAATEAVTARSSTTGPLTWAVVLAIVAGLTAAGFWLGQQRQASTPVGKVQQQLERLGRRAGVAWPQGATLHEYSALLGPRLDGAAPSLAAVVELIERARYSGRALTADEQQRLQDDWVLVRERLRRVRRG